MIAHTLFGRARRVALGILFAAPYEAMHIRELARKGRVSPSAIQRELEALSKANVLLEERRGNQRLFRANQQSPAFEGLRTLVGTLDFISPEADATPAPTTRKSTRLNLSAPYDWSNSDIGDDALIANVLRHQRFEDIVKLCAHYGVGPVDRVLQQQVQEPVTKQILTRMIGNIREGLKDVRQARAAADAVSV